MRHATFTLAVLVLPLVLASCGQNVGWVLKPVPLDEDLKETVIASDSGWGPKAKIAIIDVDGLLINNRRKSLFQMEENPVSLFVDKVDKAQGDPDVKALIVRINSPGGSVTASDIMHRRLAGFRQARNVPVVAVIEDLGASGGYYIACASDAILAHPTSITGSIGVIVQAFSLEGTMKLIGVTTTAVKSGEHKDMISPFKKLDEKDLALVQGMVDDFYGRFLQVVCEGRPKLKPDQVKKLADGRVYTGEQALKNGLVDGLGYMRDAVAEAKRRTGASKAKVVMYSRPMGYRSNYYSQSPMPAPQVNVFNITVPDLLTVGQPQFLYLWTGQ